MFLISMNVNEDGFYLTSFQSKFYALINIASDHSLNRRTNWSFKHCNNYNCMQSCGKLQKFAQPLLQAKSLISYHYVNTYLFVWERD